MAAVRRPSTSRLVPFLAILALLGLAAFAGRRGHRSTGSGATVSARRSADGLVLKVHWTGPDNAKQPITERDLRVDR
jgi:hypothetical protein